MIPEITHLNPSNPPQHRQVANALLSIKGTVHDQMSLLDVNQVSSQEACTPKVKSHSGKCEPPPPSCSFARHIVGKIAIQAAHLLITEHQPACEKHLKAGMVVIHDGCYIAKSFHFWVVLHRKNRYHPKKGYFSPLQTGA